MVAEIYAFSVTIGPGSTAASPVINQLPTPPRILRAIELTIPPGPSGLVGVAVGANGVQLYPTKRNTYVVSDDEYIHWDVDQRVNSGAWELIAYNEGALSHTIYVRLLVDLPPVPVPASLQPLAITA